MSGSGQDLLTLPCSSTDLFLFLLFFYSPFSVLRFPEPAKQPGLCLSQIRPMGWICSGSFTSQPGFHPKSWGEFGPGGLDSVISDVFSNTDNSMMLLPVIKQEPRVKKSQIKSRRCFSRQRDKSPFHTHNSWSYLGLLQSSKQLQIDGITVAFTSYFSVSSLQK